MLCAYAVYKIQLTLLIKCSLQKERRKGKIIENNKKMGKNVKKIKFRLNMPNFQGGFRMISEMYRNKILKTKGKKYFL